jgi:hypothetical protein
MCRKWKTTVSDRSEKSAARGLAVAAQLLVIPLNGSLASAQQAILLESIGAVRMAQPDEVQRMNAEREASRAQSQPAASQRTGSNSQLAR